MSFELQYNIAPVSVDDAKLIICQNSECKTNYEAPAPFSCSQDSCYYMYGTDEYYKLIVVFSDRTRESNVFEKTNFDSVFYVEVNQDSLYVTESKMGLPYALSCQIVFFLIALAVTLPIELIVSGVFFKLIRQPYSPKTILRANLISLPVVWFVFPLIPFNGLVGVFSAELFALFIEAWFIRINYPNKLSYATAFWLSFSMNLASFLIPAAFIFLLYLGAAQ